MAIFQATETGYSLTREGVENILEGQFYKKEQVIGNPEVFEVEEVEEIEDNSGSEEPTEPEPTEPEPTEPEPEPEDEGEPTEGED